MGHAVGHVEERGAQSAAIAVRQPSRAISRRRDGTTLAAVVPASVRNVFTRDVRRALHRGVVETTARADRSGGDWRPRSNASEHASDREMTAATAES